MSHSETWNPESPFHLEHEEALSYLGKPVVMRTGSGETGTPEEGIFGRIICPFGHSYHGAYPRFVMSSPHGSIAAGGLIHFRPILDDDEQSLIVLADYEMTAHLDGKLYNCPKERWKEWGRIDGKNMTWEMAQYGLQRAREEAMKLIAIEQPVGAYT